VGVDHTCLQGRIEVGEKGGGGGSGTRQQPTATASRNSHLWRGGHLPQRRRPGRRPPLPMARSRPRLPRQHCPQSCEPRSTLWWRCPATPTLRTRALASEKTAISTRGPAVRSVPRERDAVTRNVAKILPNNSTTPSSTKLISGAFPCQLVMLSAAYVHVHGGEVA